MTTQYTPDTEKKEVSAEMSRFFEYMKLVGNMKQVKRTGWVRKGVKEPESIAEHMYRMAVVAFALPADSKLDRNKCMKIALVHDMSETIVGDLTPWCGVSKQEKSKREQAATAHIASLLPGDRGQELYDLWQEYETQSSPEARFVKDMDKFEMMFQAYEYETLENRPRQLQEFFSHTMEKHNFATDLVRDWADELQDFRDKATSSATADNFKDIPTEASFESDRREDLNRLRKSSPSPVQDRICVKKSKLDNTHDSKT